MSIHELLPQWLHDAAIEAQHRSSRALDALARLSNQRTEYASALRELASAHEEASRVYVRHYSKAISADRERTEEESK